MKDKNIIVIGELNVDIILNYIKGLPAIGEEILAEDMNVTLGSSSAIFASNIASLGVNTSFCGAVGDDSFGKFILDELKRKNVDTTYVTTSREYKTGATIVLNYEQNRANVTYCGAMESVSKKDVPVEALSQFNHLHISSYFLQKGLQPDIPYLFKIAKEKGLTTSLDIQWDPDNQWSFPYEVCLPYVDVFLPNESELLLLSRKKTLPEALEKVGEHAQKIIVKCGTEGALCYEKGTVTASQPFLHEHFVDAIGAGDSFNAGFISKYLNGCHLEECLQFANLAGAVNTTASGGTTVFDTPQSFKQKAKELFNIAI